MCDDRRDDEFAVPTDPDLRTTRRKTTGHLDRHTFVPAGGQSSGLTGGVDATHLHRHRGDTRQAQHQHHHQAGDRKGRLNGAGTGTRT